MEAPAGDLLAPLGGHFEGRMEPAGAEESRHRPGADPRIGRAPARNHDLRERAVGLGNAPEAGRGLRESLGGAVEPGQLSDRAHAAHVRFRPGEEDVALIWREPGRVPGELANPRGVAVRKRRCGDSSGAGESSRSPSLTVRRGAGGRAAGGGSGPPAAWPGSRGAPRTWERDTPRLRSAKAGAGTSKVAGGGPCRFRKLSRRDVCSGLGRDPR